MSDSKGTAVVTGGGSGFGAAASKRLSRAGWRIAVLDVDGTTAETVAAAVTASGGVAIALECDVSRSEAVADAIDRAVKELGEISALFNNAGIVGEREPWGEVSPDNVRRVFEVNVFGAFNVLNSVVPSMRRHGHGAVVNTASTTSFKGYGNAVPAYVASKTAIVGFTREAAVQLAKEGIRVNAVAPGVADTPLMHRVHVGLNPDDPAAAMRELAEPIPDGRYATAEEVAEVVTFLLDPLTSSHVNGVTIPVDGGEIAA